MTIFVHRLQYDLYGDYNNDYITPYLVEMLEQNGFYCFHKTIGIN